MRRAGWSCVALAAATATVSFAQVPRPTKQAPSPESVFVERLSLTEVSDQAGPGLNVGAVVASPKYAAGLQKAADVWGINLDLFIETNLERRRKLVARLIESAESAIIVEVIHGEEWYPVAMEAAARGVALMTYGDQAKAMSFKDGWKAFNTARAGLLAKIPKYDEILPIAFPLSPLPDNFFQPSGIDYPRPVLRVARTEESLSAIAPFQTACGVIEQTGNMLHRGSATEADTLTMGIEGGGLSVKARSGAATPEKLAAVATAQVVTIRGEGGRQRDILIENDATASSAFGPAVHAPEELESSLARWVAEKRISGFERPSADEVMLRGWEGHDRLMRAGLFLVPSSPIGQAEFIAGQDSTGRKTLDFRAKDGLWQQFGEVGGASTGIATQKAVRGGLPTIRGALTGGTVGSPLRSILKPLGGAKGRPSPSLLTVDGGFFAVTAENDMSATTLAANVRSLTMDVRGPLSSDQTISIELEGHEPLVLRRTVLDFGALDEALGILKRQGLIQDWRYEGVRGRGLSANVVLLDFLGKNRRFMSSLAVTPFPPGASPLGLRFYVDGVQRLSFSIASKGGWRQEFVEVPMRVPPVPRDIELYSEAATLE